MCVGGGGAHQIRTLNEDTDLLRGMLPLRPLCFGDRERLGG